MGPTIRAEKVADEAAISEVNRLAFGGEDEARLVEALRKSGDASLSLVAEDDGRIVGHILFSRLTIATESGPVPGLALAPLAVIPECQRRGIGTALIERGLQQSAEDGHKIVIVVGHPDYYPRFGFQTKLAEPLRSPYAGPAFMALELEPGALDQIEGDVTYSAPFEGL